MDKRERESKKGTILTEQRQKAKESRKATDFPLYRESREEEWMICSSVQCPGTEEKGMGINQDTIPAIFVRLQKQNTEILD